MIEQVINVENSKLLSNIGFDVECECFYNRGSGYKLQNNSILRTGDDEIFEAPTQALVQKWLREVHGINIFMSFKPNVKKWDYMPYSVSMNGKEYTKYYWAYFALHNARRYDTYEQALEDGITEALLMLNN